MVLALTVLYPICLYEVVMTTVSLLFGAVGGTVRRLTYSSPEESNFKFEIFWLLKGFSLLFLKKCMFYYQIGILLSTEGWVSSWYELAKDVFSWATLWQS